MCLYATAQAQCVSSSCVIFYMHNVTEAPRRAAVAQRDRKQDSGPATENAAELEKMASLCNQNVQRQLLQ